MATFDLGRVTPLYKGDYNASASYELNDVVLYNGNLYWHVQATATVGILPTDATVWKLAFADEGVRAEIRGYADDAQTSADSAQASKTAAATSASNASASASQAALSAQTAQTAATGATASAQSAATSAQTAKEQADISSAKAAEAFDNATYANQRASYANESASIAHEAKSVAISNAQIAVAKADEARNSARQAAYSATSAQKYDESAQQSAVNAQTAQGLAETAQTGAETAQGLAEDARDEAQSIVDEIGAKASQIDANTASIVTLEQDCYKPYAVDTASGAVASFMDGADDIPLKSLVVNIDPVQSGSGDPSPDNVRPITGWTGAQVTRTGKNLLDVDRYGDILPRTSNDITWSKVRDGVYHASGTATANSYFNISFRQAVGNAMPCTSFIGQRLRLSTTDARVFPYIGYFKEDNTFNAIINNGDGIIPDDAVGLRAYVRIDTGTVIDADFSIQLEIGSTATSYEPYRGETYDITFPSEAGTVYGGHLDVLSGVLTVYPYYASYNGETLTGRWISDRDVYAVGATPTIGAQVVNIGAQGTEIQLSPTEIKSLLGQNNIFADTGDSTVEYRADTKLYIERLTEPDADMIADSNIVSGQYFMVGNSLYLATANIASGASVIVGTNCTRKSLSEALNEINQ